jgi:pimeloyl-ACP methyl ester carboxylesterase
MDYFIKQSKVVEERISFDFNGKPSYVNVRFFEGKRPGNLLALHGLGTQGYCFDKVADKLKLTLIAIDWYGYGKSDRRLGKNDKYEAQTCADWLLVAVTALQARGVLASKFSVLAISMSAIPLALDYEKMPIEKIILIHPAGLDKKISKKFAFGLSSGILSDGLLNVLTLHPVWELIWKFTPIQSSDERRRYIRADVLQHNGEFEVLRRYSRSGFDFFGNMRKTHYIPEYFNRIKCPVLLLYGNDTIFYKKKYVEFANKVGWKTVHLPNFPHNMVRSHADIIARSINDFLD